MSLMEPAARFHQPATAGASLPMRDADDEPSHLGQFIPMHYHHNMLLDANRMSNFKAAIDAVVFEGARVLELGGGTGVLSCFAAAHASKVYCVEFNPDMVAESRRLLAINEHGHKVEVVHADAFEYLPPEPVDVVICEMIHVGMLREKQVEVIEAFKARYRARFGERLPLFLPTAAVMAVQPLQQAYDFFGFHAPIVQFQRVGVEHAGSTELAAPSVYAIVDFDQHCARDIAWQGDVEIDADGTVNALRFITKNILALIGSRGQTQDWLNDYLVLPLNEPVSVRAGDTLKVAFSYRAGGSLPSLARTMQVTVGAGDHIRQVRPGTMSHAPLSCPAPT
ncbi:methyltransferase domain-containing protein [Methyloversatilis sp.]|uniref:methyltransferase domain-containing protein n=1 Tax=Methyloversatilis sp. TaxID=2569862 RepID=UPI0035B49801